MILLVLAPLFSGCTGPETRAAADAAYRRLEGQVDVLKLQDWASNALASKSTGELPSTNGLVIPGECLKKGTASPPDARLLGFTTGERVVAIDFQAGLQFYGIVVGRDGAVFPADYRVYQLKPGVYYIFAHN